MKRTMKTEVYDQLAERDGWKCHYCKIALVPMEERHTSSTPEGVGYPTIDHVVPIASGGTNDLGNLVLACGWCNTRKDRISAERFKESRKWETKQPAKTFCQPGRPRPAGEKRESTQLLLTPSERDLLSRAAAALGQSRSDFIRGTAIARAKEVLSKEEGK